MIARTQSPMFVRSYSGQPMTSKPKLPAPTNEALHQTTEMSSKRRSTFIEWLGEDRDLLRGVGTLQRSRAVDCNRVSGSIEPIHEHDAGIGYLLRRIFIKCKTVRQAPESLNRMTASRVARHSSKRIEWSQYVLQTGGVHPTQRALNGVTARSRAVLPPVPLVLPLVMVRIHLSHPSTVAFLEQRCGTEDDFFSLPRNARACMCVYATVDYYVSIARKQTDHIVPKNGPGTGQWCISVN